MSIKKISQEDMTELFADMAQNAPWDSSKPLLWGYFFADRAKARLEQEEIKDYHVLHMRSCKLLEHVYMDNAVDAWDAMTAYMAFAAVGDVVTVIKLGNLIYSKVKDKV